MLELMKGRARPVLGGMQSDGNERRFRSRARSSAHLYKLSFAGVCPEPCVRGASCCVLAAMSVRSARDLADRMTSTTGGSCASRTPVTYLAFLDMELQIVSVVYQLGTSPYQEGMTGTPRESVVGSAGGWRVLSGTSRAYVPTLCYRCQVA